MRLSKSDRIFLPFLAIENHVICVSFFFPAHHFYGIQSPIQHPADRNSSLQMKRMRNLLRNYPKITFGLYNGNTEHSQEKALSNYRQNHAKDGAGVQNPLENELISRETMQQTPPHILITNYSMLEYMLLRPKDDKVFSSARLRYIVLDEAHIYKGTTGMETSMLSVRT